MPWFMFGKEDILSIATIEEDFPNLQKAFVNYIKLKSLLRKQKRITARILKINKYYSRPTELFARFVEGLYLDREKVETLAPNCVKRFYELLECGYYYKLKELLIYTNKFKTQPINSHI
jgi:hypothetical protein